ncbi:MAG: hypothetical protein QOG82_1252 [Actinomycetota bacterium]|nr:hypothetical protein [Actinomycetota bacterium]
MSPTSRPVRPPELHDRRWLRRAYVAEGRSARSIAAELGCSARVVLAALHRLDIPTRPKRPVRPRALDDGERLRDLYWARCMSIAAIGAELGCSAGAVRGALHRHGIPVRALGPARIEQLYDVEWLRQAKDRWTAAQIAVLLECSETTVRWALWRSQIPAGSGPPPRPAQLDDVSFLLREYVTAGRSATAIADEIGCTTATVIHALRRHGLAVRSAARQVATRRPPSPEESGRREA